MDRTGYREYLSTLFAGQPRCYQRATSASGLDDQRAETNAADQAVTLWKQLFARLHTEGKFADQGALARDEMSQFAIGGWIDPVDAMPEKRNSRRAGVQGTAMSGRIDALCQATDNAESAGPQVTGKLVRIASAGLSWVATTDNCQRRQVQYVGVAVDVKHFRRSRDLVEQFRVVVVSAPDQVMVWIL